MLEVEPPLCRYDVLGQPRLWRLRSGAFIEGSTIAFALHAPKAKRSSVRSSQAFGSAANGWPHGSSAWPRADGELGEAGSSATMSGVDPAPAARRICRVGGGRPVAALRAARPEVSVAAGAVSRSRGINSHSLSPSSRSNALPARVQPNVSLSKQTAGKVPLKRRALVARQLLVQLVLALADRSAGSRLLRPPAKRTVRIALVP